MATFEKSPWWCSAAGSGKIAIIIIIVQSFQSKFVKAAAPLQKKKKILLKKVEPLCEIFTITNTITVIITDESGVIMISDHIVLQFDWND